MLTRTRDSHPTISIKFVKNFSTIILKAGKSKMIEWMERKKKKKSDRFVNNVT